MLRLGKKKSVQRVQAQDEILLKEENMATIRQVKVVLERTEGPKELCVKTEFKNLFEAAIFCMKAWQTYPAARNEINKHSIQVTWQDGSYVAFRWEANQNKPGPIVTLNQLIKYYVLNTNAPHADVLQFSKLANGYQLGES